MRQLSGLPQHPRRNVSRNRRYRLSASLRRLCRRPNMKLKVDRAGARRFVATSISDVAGERRRYYTTRADDDVPAILVCRDGTELHELIGHVVDANSGVEGGVTGFTLEDRVGQEHVKITIYRRLPWRGYDWTLSQVLAGLPVPESRQTGAARGQA